MRRVARKEGGEIEDEEWDWEREVEECAQERDRVEEAAEEWDEEVEGEGSVCGVSM